MKSESKTRREPSSRTRTIVMWVLAAGILVPSMLGFSAKFVELFHTLEGEQDGVFALTPILNYILASVGFFCMLLWALSNGMFRDIERPKYEMLEMDEALDHGGPSKSQ